MKNISGILATVGIFLVAAAVIGRFVGGATIFGIIGVPLTARAVLQLATVSLLLSIVAKQNGK